MFCRNDADMPTSGPGCIVVQFFLADFTVLTGQGVRCGGDDNSVFRRYSGYPDGLADVFYGYIQLTVFSHRTTRVPGRGGSLPMDHKRKGGRSWEHPPPST